MFDMSSGEIVKVAIASSIGTLIDYYDFLLAASASVIVWAPLYFSHVAKDSSAALALSLATFSSAYIMRPIGALIFGHLGDKRGRQSVLVLTLIIIFVGTIGLGLVPTYDEAGIVAPILIILFRVIQGLGFGGEWGGASTWLMEFISKEKRGLWSGILNSSVPIGIGLSSIAFPIAQSILNKQDFFSWGWRLLFLIGAFIIVIGAIIRLKLRESPLFLELKRSGKLDPVPAITVFREEWRRIVLLALSWWFIAAITAIIITPFSIAFTSAIATKQAVSEIFGFSVSAFVNLMIGIGGIIGGITTLFSGLLGDKIGRKITILISSIIFLPMPFIWFLLIQTLNPILILVAFIIIQGILQYLGFGVIPAWFSEQFKTKYRYSGSGVAYQMAGLLTGIASGFILPLLITGVPVESAWIRVALLMLIIDLVSMLAIIFTEETRGIELRN